MEVYLKNLETGVEVGAFSMEPYRKKPCLCVRDGNVLTKYASFNSAEAAHEFMEILRAFVGAGEGDEE